MTRTDRPAVLVTVGARPPAVLVTGGARRLGREIARTLAEAGWDVALHCHRSVDEAQALAVDLRALGVDADVFAADLSDEAACRALLPAAAARFPRLLAVVNNASTFEHDDAFSTGPGSMARHWQANTAAPVLLAQALHAHLSADGPVQGCVVNLLDQKLWNPNPDHFAYTLSKAALREATVMLAQAMAPRLRVCGVAPGVTLPSGPMTEAEFARAHAMTPLQRSSTPKDIARAVRFLLDSPAITGTTLLVDGGQHLSPQPRDVYYLVADPT
jgi:NAD(P)-dependent dehydrogenase (short-subunit alcohol dehydrogenase family)